jgi:predicted glycoside hydrolase/deacetylase ChbG (UPF0249 family)
MKGFLIVNADDLGMSAEINAGILFGLQQGYVSDTSLMSKGPCAVEAVHDLLAIGIDHAGIHIDLDALIGWKTGGREQYSRPVLIKMLEVEDFLKACTREARNQIERFLDFSLFPTHIDTHHHVHGFPEIFSMLLDLASEFHIPAMRFSKGGYHLPTRADIPYDSGIFSRMESSMKEKGIFFSDHYLENASSLSSVKEGITELVVHPALSGDRWRIDELEFLMSHKGIKNTGQDGIKVVSFRDVLALLPVHQGRDSGKSGRYP